jgi:hypothetical protein
MIASRRTDAALEKMLVQVTGLPIRATTTPIPAGSLSP